MVATTVVPRVLLLGCGPSLEHFVIPADARYIVGVNDSWKKTIEIGRRLDLHVFGNQSHVDDLDLHGPKYVFNFADKGELPPHVTGRVLHRIAYPKYSQRPGFSTNLRAVYPGGSLFVALQLLYGLGARRVAIAGLDWKGAHFSERRVMDPTIPARQKQQFEVVRDVPDFEVVNLNRDSACKIFPFGDWDEDTP
jgi:hypothetical protein